MTTMGRLFRAVLALFLLPEAVLAQTAGPDWPCVQRLVPELSAAQIWSGPPLEEVDGFWATDPVIAPLVPELVALETPLSEARVRIASLAEQTDEAARSGRLRLLFAGVLEGVNGERSRTIAGIKRYARRQQALAARIAAENAELRPDREPIEAEGETALMLERRNWDLRVFDIRESMLSQICERPVLLEQRAFALAREIEDHLR